MALITDNKDERAVKEQQAARKLQESLGRAPTQTEIYQQAYQTAYPVFQSDYGTGKLKKRLDKYAQNVYGAAGNIRKGVINKAEEARYQEGLQGIFANNDPLVRQRMMQNLERQRTQGQNQQFNQRYNQYAAERGRTLFDYQQALGNQNQALQGASQAELADLEYQRQLEKEQRDFEKQIYLKSLTRRSGGSSGSSSRSILSSSDKLNMIGLGLDFSNQDDIVKYAQYKTQNSFGDQAGSQVQEESQAPISFDEFAQTIASQQGVSLSNDPFDPMNTQIMAQLQNLYNEYLTTNFGGLTPSSNDDSLAEQIDSNW